MLDEELMQAYAAGDETAFRALFRRWAPRVHAFLLRALAERGAAEDVLQATFFKVHRARHAFRPDGQFRPWLFGIATNAMRDELRRRVDTPVADLSDAGPEVAPAPEPIPLEASQRARAVRRALEALPPNQRAVLQLHRFEQLSFTEIGAALGISAGAAKLRAFRAYQTLRLSLSALREEDVA